MSKKTYLLIIGMMALLLSFNNHAKAQSSTFTHYYIDSCGGYGMFSVTATGDSSDYLETSYGDGTTDTTHFSSLYGGPPPTLYFYFTHNYMSAGTYTVKHVLYNATSGRIDSTSYSQVIYGCSYISGKLYNDVNGNCTFDAGDHYIWAGCSIKVDSAGVPVDTISGYGIFYYRALSLTATYTFSIITPPGDFSLTCPSGGTISATPSFSSIVHAGDFGFTCGSTSSGFDAAIHTYTHTGRHSFYAGVLLTNNTCADKSGTLTVNIDPAYTISSTYPSGTISGHTVTWNYSGLSLDSSQYFVVYGSAYPWLSPGTSISTDIYINHLTGDTVLSDDSVTIADTVTSSWDPNAKVVLPKGNIQSGEMLTYTLAFENTGNAPAMNIHILDTLASYVDPNSIQIVASTHPVTLLKFTDPISGHTILRFDFVNINLPDSSHHGQADGYVMFSISSKSGLTNGTQINNRAGIYFDDNEVVMTNTVTNTIHSLGIANVNSISPVSVYPNPVENDLYIKTKGGYQHLTIINNLGQVVLQQELHNNDSHINVKTLQPGMYYIMLKGNSGVKVEKIEKL